MKANMVVNIFEGADGFKSELPAGSFQWSFAENETAKPHGIIFICPCGCKEIRSVPVSGPRAWFFNGNLEAPTLTPSIQVIGECKWHGWLTNGEWRNA